MELALAASDRLADPGVVVLRPAGAAVARGAGGEALVREVFQIVIASKGAAGVTGAGLAGGLQSHRPDLVDGVGLIVGIDRFMSEARAVTNFSGNAVATVIIGKWVGELDQPPPLAEHPVHPARPEVAAQPTPV
jgi:hypothetical protein